ncbi:MAG: tetratricopeptide repeat protein [Woeseiaceae bacterium]
MNDQENSRPQDIQLLHQLAQRNRFEQMKGILRRALPQHPDDEDLLYYSAFIDWRENKLEAAEETLGKLLSGSPHSYPGRRLLASVLEERQDLAGAEAQLVSLLADYPEDAEAYAEYSLLMLKTMHIDKAGKLAARAMELDPDNDLVLRASVFFKAVSNPGPDADADLRQLIERYPDAAHTGLTLVSTLNEKGRYGEALPIAQEVLRKHPESTEIVDLVVHVKAAAHWSMVPLRPFMRWGWSASIVLWFAAVVGFRVLDGTPLQPYVQPLLYAFLAFVVYSWVYPPFLRWLLRR